MTENAEGVTNLSYEAHERVYDEYRPDGSKAKHAESWLDPSTVDRWRFERMYRLANPFLETYPGARWITVGDGRYGLDSNYLRTHGAEALPTDISGTLLREAKDRGLVADYRVENAERLSFDADSFDFALCKESYHHFPRPMLALHEICELPGAGSS